MYACTWSTTKEGNQNIQQSNGWWHPFWIHWLCDNEVALLGSSSTQIRTINNVLGQQKITTAYTHETNVFNKKWIIYKRQPFEVEDEAFIWMREGRWRSIQLRQKKQIEWQMRDEQAERRQSIKTTQYTRWHINTNMVTRPSRSTLVAKRNQQQQSHAAICHEYNCTRSHLKRDVIQ